MLEKGRKKARVGKRRVLKRRGIKRETAEELDVDETYTHYDQRERKL